MRKLLYVLALIVVGAANLGPFAKQAFADPIRCPSELTKDRLARFHSICYDSCHAEKPERQRGCRESCDRTDRYCANEAAKKNKGK
jgi:hypothetical protein